MNRQRECEEIVSDVDAGKSYRFAGTFSFIRMLSLAGRDPSLIFADLAEGLLPPEEIKNVIKFSIVQIDDVDIQDQKRESTAVEFIERAGLQDSSLLARMMMSHAMIGAIKKKHIRQKEAIQGALFKSSRSHWMTFVKAGSLWMGSLVISTTAACMIFSTW